MTIPHVLARSVLIAVGIFCALVGSLVPAAILPLIVGAGGWAVFFVLGSVLWLPMVAGLLWLSQRCIGRWTWALASLVLVYLGIWTIVNGVSSNAMGGDAGWLGRAAGSADLVAAVPFAAAAVGRLQLRH